jgi:putative DNA-invertase from lambdoid prophage Rac
MRTFIYCRVSTREQDTQNQVLAIERAGYKVPEQVISEDISGSVQAMQRPKFRAMVEHKLEAGDQLVVLKLDRLGRDNIDVQQTIDMLLERGVKVVSLDLPARDLTSSKAVNPPDVWSLC